MSASVTGNDLGSMGAPSNDGALGPLLEVLRANTTATETNTGALAGVEMSVFALIHSFNQISQMLSNIVTLSAAIGSLRVGVERLTATIVANGGPSGGGGGGGRGRGVDLEALERKWIVKEYKGRADFALKEDKDLARIEQNARKLWRRGLEQQAANRQAEEQELAELERKWIVREYNERLDWNKKQGKEIEKLEEKWLAREFNDRRKAQQAAAKSPGAGTVLGQGIGALLGGLIGKGPGAMIGSQIGGTIGGSMGGGGSSSGGGGGGGVGGGGPIGNALGMMGPFGKAMGIAGAVVMGATAAFNKLHSAVSALAKSAMLYAPGIAIAMERALKDLDAVIGAYSAKAGQAMIPLVRVIADYLFPAMQALGDAVALVIKTFTPLVETIMMILMPVVTGLANIFSFLWKLLSPIVDVLIAAFNAVAVIFTFLVGVINGVVDALSAFFAPLFVVFDLFTSLLIQAGDGLKQLLISMTSWIPFIGKAVQEALKPNSTQGIAAASTAKYSNAQSIGDTAAQNAFIATSGRYDPKDEFARQMIENDIPNKWAKELEAKGKPPGVPVRQNDGAVVAANNVEKPMPIHGGNNRPIRMGM